MWSLQDFSGIHDTFWIEQALYPPHPVDAHLALGVMQRVCLHGTDAMFSRDGAII